MQDGNAAARETVSEAALDQLFRKARSHMVLNPPVSDDDLHAIYDLTKWGPTTANSQPQRIVFLRSEEAKQRLLPALSALNLKKTIGAPVIALLAYDRRYFEHLPRMFPHNLFVRRDVHAINLVVRHIAVQPLNLGSQITQHPARFLRNALHLLSR